ncbi:restriction endonuclease-like protein [Solirubrobacter phytolaccae]|uniref:Restriction endonuclease-like protein n=1 Tax=Solirubrobacter phytolaccae TaxID=1404360 RepID=A0A9X3NHM0_9ACTN|nr:DUF2357 domain-containing protein [Solirubrobacter phytolaccae]MDA0181332.1 restriction endonuclease-like protein [Solirubrobacter phytolaccae]
MSPPTSRWSFADRRGAPLPAPVEWERAAVVLDIELSELASVTVHANGQPLELSASLVGDRTVVHAKWPRLGAGFYLLELNGPGWTDHAPVTVTPSKLTAADHDALIDDLERRLPANIAVSLQRLGANVGVDVLAERGATFAEEVLRLRRACLGEGTRAGLFEVLEALKSNPHSALAKRSNWRAARSVRRVDHVRLHQAYRRATPNPDGSWPVPEILPEPLDHATVDTYENRVILFLCGLVERRLQAVIKEARRRRAPTVLADLLELAAGLAQRVRQARFLEQVTALSGPPTTATPTLLERRYYRDAFEGLAQLQKGFVARLAHAEMQVDLTDIPKLYETWGTLIVIAALLEVAPTLGYRVERHDLVSRRANEAWVHVLGNGRACVTLVRATDGTRLEVVPQRTYSRTTTPLRSLSFSQRPDVSIEMTTAAGRSVWIFDPKYKLATSKRSMPKKEDIDTMHAYRDAIRDGDDERVVVSAAILYPGPSQEYGAGIAAIEARPLDGRALQTALGELLTVSLGR